MILSLDHCATLVEAGAKVMRLAQARAAGFPVLDGVVVLPGAIERDELSAALAEWKGPVIVRSSASVEDGAGQSGAGVFESVAGVEGIDAVSAAIERVRQSAQRERAQRYAPEAATMAVLIQPMVSAGTLLVALSTPDSDSEFVVEERAIDAPEWVTPRIVVADQELRTLLLVLRIFFGWPMVVELARGAAGLVVLQVRPRPQGDFAAPWPSGTFAVAGSWQRDPHNPAPLSMAQSELVAWVERLAVGSAQRVLGGYLYTASALRPPDDQVVEELARWFDDEWAPAMRRLFAGLDGSVAAALDAYAQMYRGYVTQVAPARRRARQRLDQFLQAELGESLDAHGALLAGVGGATFEREQALWVLDGSERAWSEYAARFGEWAPAWDVAVPSDGESRARIESWSALGRDGESPQVRRQRAEVFAQHHAATIRKRLAQTIESEKWSTLWQTARTAVRIGEDDDAIFFAAQHAVRLSLLQRGDALVKAGRIDTAPDVFSLPFDLGDLSGGDLRPLVASARAFSRRAHATVPPSVIDDGVPRPPPPPSKIIRGRATAGQAQGRIVRLQAHTPWPLPPDAVLWVEALLPSLSPYLAGAVALITESGGVASHGALLARERGLPAVIGVGPSDLVEGAHVLVDGAAGEVTVLD